jgi:hypothetical protein
MSKVTDLTKDQLVRTKGININPDNYSWTILEVTLLEHDNVVRFKAIKTSKLKKLMEISQEEGEKMFIPEEMTKIVTIKLNDTTPENQIFLPESFQNLANSFTFIFKELKKEVR